MGYLRVTKVRWNLDTFYCFIKDLAHMGYKIRWRPVILSSGYCHHVWEMVCKHWHWWFIPVGYSLRIGVYHMINRLLFMSGDVIVDTEAVKSSNRCGRAHSVTQTETGDDGAVLYATSWIIQNPFAPIGPPVRKEWHMIATAGCRDKLVDRAWMRLLKPI